MQSDVIMLGQFWPWLQGATASRCIHGMQVKAECVHLQGERRKARAPGPKGGIPGGRVDLLEYKMLAWQASAY